MAILDYSTLVAGTAQTWASTGGDHAWTLTSKADGVAREGDKGDFFSATLGLPELLDFRLESAVGAAATNGKEIELYAGYSDNATAGTDNPANLTGVDADLSNPDELKYQAIFIGSLVLSNARGTNVQKQRFQSRPRCRYMIPLAVNKSGQTLSGTAGNHKLVVTPYYRQRQG